MNKSITDFISKILLITGIFITNISVFSFTNKIPDLYFHDTVSVLKSEIQSRQLGEDLGYKMALLTIFDLSDNLLKLNGYYSNIEYNVKTLEFSLTASIVDPVTNEVLYISIISENIPESLWQEFENAIAKNNYSQIQQGLNNFILNYPISFIEAELNVVQPLDTKTLSNIFPVFKNAPESLALSSYPAELYIRLIYDKQNKSLVLNSEVDYLDRAKLVMLLESVTKGNLFLNEYNIKYSGDIEFEVIPMLASIELINQTLIQDMIKLELDSDSEFLSSIVRHKLAFDIKNKAKNSDQYLVNNYYLHLAEFIKSPISFKIQVKNTANSYESFDQFWSYLIKSIENGSRLQVIDKPKETDNSKWIQYRLQKARLDNNLNHLIDIVDKSLEINYFANGQHIN